MSSVETKPLKSQESRLLILRREIGYNLPEQMGEEREDPQKLKKIAAAAYDYENDSRWADYWSNILIPPHLSSRSDVIDHFKRKFYQRFIVRSPSLSHFDLLLVLDSWVFPD